MDPSFFRRRLSVRHDESALGFNNRRTDLMNVSIISIDLAKSVFHLCGQDVHGKVVLRKRLQRGELLSEIAQLARVPVAMEACGGAHHWGRCLRKLGFPLKLIPPQFVKPFVRGNKTDKADAEAIAEAASRESTPTTELKEVDQQELQHLHRGRELLIKHLTALGNALHGILLEFGIVIPKGKLGIRMIPEKLEGNSEMTTLGIEHAQHLLSAYWATHERVTWYDKKIAAVAKAHPVCKRLLTVPGIGPITATAIVAKSNSPACYRNGRAFSASLGLVPKQHSTGGKARLLGISKRGDGYIRRLLVHGARSLMYRAHLKSDPTSRWITNLKERKGWNKTCVALANKTARICWSILKFEREYDSRFAAT
jgi:transposase